MMVLPYRPALACEIYQHPKGEGPELHLEYRRWNGKYLVVWDIPGAFPGKKPCETKEEARQVWRDRREAYNGMGYEMVYQRREEK